MKIGIDCRNMLDPQNERGGGVERYTFTLITELVQLKEHSFVLFIPKNYQSDELFIERENITIHYVQDSGMPFWSRHFGFSAQVHKYHLDIFYSPAASLPLGLRIKSIVTVHDLAIYDHPEWFPGGQWFSKKVLVPYSLKKAEKIVAVSNVSKRDCIRLFGIRDEKIAVVHNALPNKKYFFKIPAFKRKLPSRYILFIGTIEPRKNLKRVFDTFLELKKREGMHDLSLVVLGNDGWKVNEIFNEHSKEDLEKESVYFFSGITENEKWRFLEKSELLFFPSLYEGFGLPVLEAFEAGKRVVTSKEGALKEVGGNDAVYIDPYSIENMVSTLETELKKEDIYFHPNIERFSRERFTQEILSVIEEVF